MRVVSKNIYLRLVTEDDADFIVKLRTDPKNARFISSTSSCIFDQKNWIRRYKEREALQKEFYFIGCTLNGESFGTTRLYNFNNCRFTNGSWITQKDTQLDHSILLDILGRAYSFNDLNFKECFFDVRKKNRKVINYHSMLGAKYEFSDELNNYYTIQRDIFFKSVDKFVNIGIISSEDLCYKVIEAQ